MLHPYPPGIAEKVLSLAASFATLLADFFKALWRAENVIQTILSVLFLLAIYALCYWLYLVVGQRRFISIAPFRVWGSSPPQYPGEGIAARLGDELLKLQRDMLKSHHEAESRGTFIPGADLVFFSPKHLKQAANFTTMRSDPSSLEQRTGVNFYAAPLAKATEGASFYTTHFELPSMAQVTVEYGGFSPEVFNSFLRRLFRRQVVISGDMIPSEPGLLLVGRSSGVGPWEVHAERSDVSTLHQLLQEMAVRAVIDLHPATELAIGNALARRQMKAEAAQNLDESLRQARLATMALPKEGTSFYNLGVGLANKGQFDDAIVAYNKALQIKPDFPKALNNLGIALARKGQFDEAIAALNKALQIKPDFPEALNNLGIALARKGQLDEAIAAYNKALQLRPDSVEALNSLGNALANKGQLDDAIAAYNKALQFMPNHASLHYNLGLALRKAGKEEEARRAFAKAQQLDPKFKPPDPQ
ncbi:MAG: tetratricopeptide repeat protein [Acidobacteria bacterium]|nr:tetratricopeptide repeat protein [Acidobacteriota bacterium]